MGWTALYIAFGVIALWLLSEVLLQYKARLRWRLLAFAGFLGVVLGVLSSSVVVIGLGFIAFAVGQTYVTLSFRRGFASGWAVGNRAHEGGGGSKRRRGGAAPQEPAPEAFDEHHGQDVHNGHDDVFAGPLPPESAAEATAVYDPQPLPEDTGSYGVYTDAAHAAGPQDQPQTYAYDGNPGYGQQQYGYGDGQQQYAGYSDPYAGTQTYGGGSYDTTHDGGQQHGQQAYGQDPYATGGYAETPPGGVWGPQQRTTDNTFGGEPPAEQPYPYQGNGTGHGNGYDEQYRY
ncbi:MAG: DUF3040 domain-containing protein [Streptomyces sp.]|jgi:hypothetical protein|nr:DUF3040 domain-containing protein [Streptomyces sp.]